MKCSFTPFSKAQESSAFEMNSGPLSTRMLSGLPRIATSSASTATTYWPVIDVFTSMAKHSRVRRSTTFSVRKVRPAAVPSCTKSIAQASFARLGCGSSTRGTAASFFRNFLLTSHPFSRTSRSTSFLFTVQPFRFSITCSRRYPKRGRSIATWRRSATSSGAIFRWKR